MASNSSRRSAPQRTLPEGFSAVPTSPTDVIAKDAIVWQIVVGNPTNGNITFSVSDKQSSPKNPINETVTANSMQLMSFGEGVKFLGGINWTAGGAGLVAEIFGTYNG